MDGLLVHTVRGTWAGKQVRFFGISLMASLPFAIPSCFPSARMNIGTVVARLSSLLFALKENSIMPFLVPRTMAWDMADFLRMETTLLRLLTHFSLTGLVLPCLLSTTASSRPAVGTFLLHCSYVGDMVRMCGGKMPDYDANISPY